MNLEFFEKIKESAVSVVPILAIVAVLHVTIAPLQAGELLSFFLGGFAVILGLSIFLVGADIGLVPFGQLIGSSLTKRRSLSLVLIVSFVIGFAITIAEPDVQVLASQVSSVITSIDRQSLLLLIAVGVGFFLLLGITRIVFQVSLRWILVGCYVLVFIGCAFIDPSFIGVAFDAGGATTGPITVPFIMAMGIGVAHAAKSKEGEISSFGVVGLASIGPIAAVVVMGLLSSGTSGSAAAAEVAAGDASMLARFVTLLLTVGREILLAFIPLAGIFIVAQLTLLRMPRHTLKRMSLGLLYTFIGLVIFMMGVHGGFSAAGQSLGKALGTVCSGLALIPIGILLGSVVVCAEPAVWVLTAQVEEVSGGTINRFILLAALSISVATAVGLGMVRVITEISIWWMLLPGYAAALLLTRFCPPLFTAIAFDSGGVASGPMSTTFVLSLTLGASGAVGGNPATDAFGMVAMIAMAPLITIQVLGLALARTGKKQPRTEGAQ